MQNMTPYDYTRLELFASKAQLTSEQRDELDVIFKDFMGHFFQQIDLIITTIGQQNLKKIEDYTHVQK